LAWVVGLLFDYLRVHTIHIYLSKLDQFSGDENIPHNLKIKYKNKNRVKISILLKISILFNKNTRYT
jgi:hypothetical protein